MLRREVEILKTVKHPNIVEIVAVYDEPNYLHIVSELCTGGELFERIIKKSASAEKHFSEADAARMLAEILGAVAYCHREACNFRSLLDSDPAGTYPGPLCRFGGRNVFPRHLSPFALSNRLKTTPFKSNRGVGGRRRRTIGNRKSLLGAVRVRCDVAHQAALERRPPRHPSSPLHAATAASAKDASRDRRLAQPPRTCPDSDACSSRASATGLN